MNDIRFIFGVKLVIVFALAALFLASLKVQSGQAKSQCPCPVDSLYEASVAQAESLGLSNTVEFCLEDVNEYRVVGEQQQPCFTDFAIVDLTTQPRCGYVFGCTSDFAPDYSYNFGSQFISPEEVKACRTVMKSIARRNGIITCLEEAP